MSPMRLVACDSAVSSVSGSSWPGGRNSPRAGERRTVGQEQRVELRALGQLGQADPVVQVEVGPRVALRQPPRRLVVARLHQERVEMQFRRWPVTRVSRSFSAGMTSMVRDPAHAGCRSPSGQQVLGDRA